MEDVQGREVRADHVHHRVDRDRTHRRQPLGFGFANERIAVGVGERAADGLEVVARVKSLADRHGLAQRLAVPQESRSREHIDLRARIVDVVFARDPVTRERQKVRERVPEHGAPSVPDMHRPGGIGGHVFDVDRVWLGGPAPAEVCAVPQDDAKNIIEQRGLDPQIEEARSRDLGPAIPGSCANA